MFLTIKLCTYELFSIEQIIYIKMDLALNNLQRLICHKTKQTKSIVAQFLIYFFWVNFIYFPTINSLREHLISTVINYFHRQKLYLSCLLYYRTVCTDVTLRQNSLC